MNINSVLLITKKGSREASVLGREVKAWLEELGVRTVLSNAGPADSLSELKDSGLDLIMVLGGDGTILSQARKLLHLQTPFLGINLGQVGFMAEMSPDSWKEHLQGAVLDWRLSKRMVLGYHLKRGNRTVKKGCAINEVVINRGEMARLITVLLDLPGGVRQSIRSDGIIFSTPTGSTAYSFSAGGPLVHPELEAMIITSICPFLHDFKPLVLPASETLAACSDVDAWLTVDGQLGFRIRPGDRVEIARHDEDFKILCVPVQTFAAKLEAKGFLKRR